MFGLDQCVSQCGSMEGVRGFAPQELLGGFFLLVSLKILTGLPFRGP